MEMTKLTVKKQLPSKASFSIKNTKNPLFSSPHVLPCHHKQGEALQKFSPCKSPHI